MLRAPANRTYPSARLSRVHLPPSSPKGFTLAWLPCIHISVPHRYQDANLNAAAGFILNPYYNSIWCSFPADGGTMNRICSPTGASAACLPGCYRFTYNNGGPYWCSPDNPAGNGECAYGADNQVSMLEHQRSFRQAMHNEVVVNIDEYLRSQPQSIEAVFYMSIKTCKEKGSAMLCEGYARRTHTAMMEKFGLTAEQLPLVVFDPANWQAPFSLAP